MALLVDTLLAVTNFTAMDCMPWLAIKWQWHAQWVQLQAMNPASFVSIFGYARWFIRELFSQKRIFRVGIRPFLWAWCNYKSWILRRLCQYLGAHHGYCGSIRYCCCWLVARRSFNWGLLTTQFASSCSTMVPLGSECVRHGVIKEVCPLKQAGVPTPCFCIVFDLINLSLIYVKLYIWMGSIM